MITKSSLVLITILLSIHVWAKDVYVEGYTRSDGTVVQVHYRTAPDNTINNNFSTKGNVNPYTGELGWIEREPTERSYEYSTSTYSLSPELRNEYGSATKFDQETRRYKRVDGDTLLVAATLAYLLMLPLLLFVLEFVKGPTRWIDKYHGRITSSMLSRGSAAIFSLMIFAYLASYGPV